MSRKTRNYTSDDIDVQYDVKRCIHVAACVRGLPEVFDTDKTPWVQPDQAEADKVAEVVLRCPTGALHFTRKDGGEAESAPQENRIIIAPDGPLYVRGDVEILTADGTVLLEDTRIALCRCGASQDKPFCDGSHEMIVFQDEGELGQNMLGTDQQESDGKLTFRLATDGPILLQGPTQLEGGGASYEGSKGALCRCGGSENKPFCDGTHTRIDFKAE